MIPIPAIVMVTVLITVVLIIADRYLVNRATALRTRRAQEHRSWTHLGQAHLDAAEARAREEQAQKPFVQQHLDALRAWRKPDLQPNYQPDVEAGREFRAEADAARLRSPGRVRLSPSRVRRASRHKIPLKPIQFRRDRRSRARSRAGSPDSVKSRTRPSPDREAGEVEGGAANGAAAAENEVGVEAKEDANRTGKKVRFKEGS